MDELNPRKGRRRLLGPLAAGLCTMLLLVAQASAIAHLHLDGSVDTSCAICPLVKAQTAASDPVLAPPPLRAGYQAPRASSPHAFQPPARGTVLARGPPSP